MAAASLAGILAFGILSDDDPVQVAGSAFPQRGLRASEDLCGPDIGILLEGLTDGQTQAPEGDMVGDI